MATTDTIMRAMSLQITFPVFSTSSFMVIQSLEMESRLQWKLEMCVSVIAFIATLILAFGFQIYDYKVITRNVMVRGCDQE